MNTSGIRRGNTAGNRGANARGFVNDFYNFNRFSYARNANAFGYGGSSYGYPYDTVTSAIPRSAHPDFAALGDRAFRDRRYDDAIHYWQHALVDDPQNGGLVLLLGQAYFATGHYDEAAGAVQQGMGMLPRDQWGMVVEHYRDLYDSSRTYTNQLRALEAARTKDPSPALHYLLGYHYAFLGHPSQAVRELNKALRLQPQDPFAKDLRDLMEGNLTPEGTPAPAEQPVERSAEQPPPAEETPY